MRGIKDVALEEVHRIARELMGDPREDPLVQLGIAVVVAGQIRWVDGERPGVEDGQQHADRGRRAPSTKMSGPA